MRNRRQQEKAGANEEELVELVTESHRQTQTIDAELQAKLSAALCLSVPHRLDKEIVEIRGDVLF